MPDTFLGSPFRTKREIAVYFRVSPSTIEEWARQRLIPVHKPTSRKNLYHLQKCERALARFEAKEVGHRKEGA